MNYLYLYCLDIYTMCVSTLCVYLQHMTPRSSACHHTTDNAFLRRARGAAHVIIIAHSSQLSLAQPSLVLSSTSRYAIHRP